MALTREMLMGWQVEAEGDATLQEAADELRSHLGTANAAGKIVLRSGPAGPGFIARVTEDLIELDADGPRAALDAAYWLLDRIGFVWPEPGTPAEVDPEPDSIETGEYRFEPRFPKRTLILGQDALHDEWRDWVEWASRNRFTTIFLHDTPPSRMRSPGTTRPETGEALAADRGGWMFERWDSDGPEILAALADLGMDVAFGGHHLPAMIPREHFDSHPDWFTERNGSRDPRYNFCTSSPGARDEFQRNVAAFLRRFRGANVYHLWADDIAGGGWCSCDACRGFTPSEQALIATNLAAEVLASAAPDSTIAHIAYHDTLTAPGAIEPLANVDILFAPRERCYAHALDDPTCHRNASEYWPAFGPLPARFPGRPDRVQIFEYQSDAILFKGLAPPHLTTLPADARAYAAAGAGEFQDLMVGDRPWVGPPWQAWWFARCAWGDESLDDDLARFCRAAFGDAAAGAERWYRASDDAYRTLLDLHDLEPMRRHDVLDFSDTPRATLKSKAGECLDALAAMEAAAEHLTAGEPPGTQGARLARERTQAAFVLASLASRAHRIAAWDAALDGDDARARIHLDAERASAAAVRAWDQEHNLPGYAVITHGARMASDWHRDQVAALLGDK